MRLPAALGIVLAIAGVAAADPEREADRAFRIATQRASAGDAEAIAAFELLGAARPITRWTDDAWAEAARLAERVGDYARARRALDQVIATGRDPSLIRRARGSLARLISATGGGQWDEIAREHQRLAGDVFDHGDPQEALRALEELVRANPRYPRATDVWLVLAQAWEREGEPDHAIALLREASGDRHRIGLALARALIRRSELRAAERQLALLDALPDADRPAIADVRARLAVANQRSWIRRAVWIGLVALAILAAIVLWRDTGSVRVMVRRLARPPNEAIFLLPIGAVLIGVAAFGNPLVAKALLGIVVAGIAVAWLSGALFEARHHKHGRIGAWRATSQALLALAVVAGAVYLALDRDRMLDLVEETLEHGPVPR